MVFLSHILFLYDKGCQQLVNGGGICMKNKDIERLMNFNFGDYLKESLKDKGMTMRELSKRSGLDYKILSKITATKSKPRNLRYQEFLVIMLVLEIDIDDFLEMVLTKTVLPKQLKAKVNSMQAEELALLNNLLDRVDGDKIGYFFKIMNVMASCFLATEAGGNGKQGGHNTSKSGNKGSHKKGNKKQ